MILNNADKPPIADLAYFLDFQTHKIWAPIYNDLPLGAATNRATPSPAIQFNLMGPKLYINTNKVLHSFSIVNPTDMFNAPQLNRTLSLILVF